MIPPRGASQVQFFSWMECLADPPRLRALRLLERNELGVNELCSVLQLPQSTVSRHLKMLLEQGWVKSRRQGTTHLYRMILDELAPAARRLWTVAREQTDAWPTVRQDHIRLDALLARKHDDGHPFFAGAAGEWDRIRGELYGNSFTTRAMLALLPGDSVIADLGCGSGSVSQMLAASVKKVIAVDNSSAMLKAAKARLDKFNNVEVRRGELTDLPIADGECSAAVILLVLTYLDNPAGALRETHRILRPGGRAILVDLLPHDRDDFRRQLGQASMGFEPAQVDQMLREAGFGNVIVNPLPPETKVKGPALFLAVATR